MEIATTKYIRKPLYVDAVRINAGNFDALVDWCQGEVEIDETSKKQFIKVRVHNPKNPRQTKAFVGDWLLYTERGYKVYTNKAFHSSFDKAEVASKEELEAAFGNKKQGKKSKAERLQRGGEVPTDGAGITQVVVEPGIQTETPQTLVTETPMTVPESVKQAMANSESEVKSVEAKAQAQEALSDDDTKADFVDEPKVVPPPSTVPPVQSTATTQAVGAIETEGGTVETATPEAIAEVVNEQPPMPDNVEAQPKQENIEPAAAEGKRVLSVAEQREMTPAELKDLIVSGDVVLAQDIASA